MHLQEVTCVFLYTLTDCTNRDIDWPVSNEETLNVCSHTILYCPIEKAPEVDGDPFDADVDDPKDMLPCTRKLSLGITS